VKDVQNFQDERGIDLQKVGVKDVHLPFLIKMRNGKIQSVLAIICLTVDLARQFKGTHMSRFIEVLNHWSQQPISTKELQSILADIRDRTGAKKAHIDMKFKYFLEKSALDGRLSRILDYDCLLSGELGKEYQFILGIIIPVTSFRPCSEEFSQYGSHSQQNNIKVKVKFRTDKFLWIDDLVKMIEVQASSQVYPLLKREDEKFVTEHAYDKAEFVEDVISDLALVLREHDKISWFDIECVNFESRHNHNVYVKYSENK
jgi:GTP cyclohydrolase I